VDPDGNEPVSLFVIAALVGGGLNLWSNKDKIKDFRSGLMYFASGALGGAVSVVNPLAGGYITGWGNVGIDVMTGNLPDFSNPAEAAKYAGFTILDAVGAGSAGKISRGIVSFGETIKNGWKEVFRGSNVKPVFSYNTLDAGRAGFDIAEFSISASKTRIVDIAASSIRFADDAAKGGAEGGLNLFKFGSKEATSSAGWKSGDRFLKMFDQGSPKLNWKQNSAFLRSEMNLGKPIFDSYRLPNGNLIPTGGFLNAERSLLQSRGWLYNSGQGAWLPPIR